MKPLGCFLSVYVLTIKELVRWLRRFKEKLSANNLHFKRVWQGGYFCSLSTIHHVRSHKATAEQILRFFYWSSILPRISLQPWALTSTWGHPLSVRICTCVHTAANVLVENFVNPGPVHFHVSQFLLLIHQLMNKPELGWTGWVTGEQDRIATHLLTLNAHI